MQDPYRESAASAEEDPEARMVIGSELHTGETLRWVGRPKRGIVFSPFDVFFIPFSLAWGGFALMWESAAIYAAFHNPFGFIFALFGLPFVGVGLFMIFGRFIFDAYRRARMFYGLTDTRAIIVYRGKKTTCRSIDLASCGDLAFEEGAKQTGTLRFGPELRRSHPMFRNLASPEFWLVANARAVYELALEAKAEHARRSNDAARVRVPPAASVEEEASGAESTSTSSNERNTRQ